MKSRNNKKLTIFGVLFILIVFPIITYVYLDSGLKFRVSITSQLVPKDSIMDFELYDFDDGASRSFDDLIVKSYAILLRGDGDSQQHIKSSDPFYLLLTEFSDREELFLVVDEASFPREAYTEVQEMLSRDYTGLYTTDLESLASIFPDSIKNTYAAALVDSKSRVLAFYDMSREDNVNQMVEHLSVVLPNQPMFTRRYRSGR